MRILGKMALALVWVALLAGPAVAQQLDAMYSKDTVTKLLDKNGDSYLDREELKNSNVLKALDADKDGRISQEEYRVLFNDPEVAEKQFLRMDHDGNDHLTKDEMVAPLVVVRF